MLRIHWEKWKKYPLDKRYKVSSDGRVKHEGKLLKEYINNKSGYKMVRIAGQFKAVHNVVAITYLGKVSGDKLTVDHKDSNKRNNTVSNLELVSEAENQKRAVNNIVLIKKKKNGKGILLSEIQAQQSKASAIRDEKMSKIKAEIKTKVQEQLFTNYGISFLEAINKDKTSKEKQLIVIKSGEELVNNIHQLNEFNANNATTKTPTKITNRIIRGILLLGDYGGYRWEKHYKIVPLTKC